MNKLTIYLLNKSGGVFNTYVDIVSLMSFFQRSSANPNNFVLFATKNGKPLAIEKIDPRTLVKTLNDFNNQNNV